MAINGHPVYGERVFHSGDTDQRGTTRPNVGHHPRMAHPVTGNDWARLLRVAQAHGIDYGTADIPGGGTHRVDPRERVVYIDGRLPMDCYARAFAEGIDELVPDNVTALSRTAGRARRSS